MLAQNTLVIKRTGINTDWKLEERGLYSAMQKQQKLEIIGPGGPF